MILLKYNLEISFLMKNKSISKYLSEEFYNFLAQVVPKDQREYVLKNSFITGGSLYNLKMYRSGHKLEIDSIIKDYDIYFSNKQTLVNLIRSEVKFYHELVDDNADSWNEFDIDDLKKLRISYQSSNGKEYDETDYFADDTNTIFLRIIIPESLYDLLRKDRKDKYSKYKILKDTFTYVTGHSMSFDKYQVITRFTGSPDVIHSFFDFDHAKGVYMPFTGEVMFPASIIEAMYEKELKYTGSKYPVASIFRMIKFLNRGFTISKIELLKILFQIMQMDFTNKDTLYDQLEGFYGDDIVPDIQILEDHGIDSSLFEEIIKTLESKLVNCKYPTVLTENMKARPRPVLNKDLPF